MKPSEFIWGVVLGAVFIALFLGLTAAFGADYIFQPINMPEAKFTQPNGINDLGDVVGVFADCDFCPPQSFIYTDGQYFDIGVSGATHTTPFGINKHGVIVGAFATRDGTFAFLMDEQNTTVLDGHGDAINNNPDSVLVGYRSTAKFNQSAMLWRAGNYTTLINPDLPGILGSVATGINDKGDIVGYWFTDVDGVNVKTTGFVIKSGKLAFTGDLIPLGINSDGVIVGMAGAGNDGAVLENGALQLIKYPGSDYTHVGGINNRGVIVGYYLAGGQGHGFTATPMPAFAANAKAQAALALANGKK